MYCVIRKKNILRIILLYKDLVQHLAGITGTIHFSLTVENLLPTSEVGGDMMSARDRQERKIIGGE
jgi:hypothetical protein